MRTRHRTLLKIISRRASHRQRQLSSSSSSAESTNVVEPTKRQLRIVALRSAIPMVGFGYMDNLIMIQAGEAIDMSIGVAFGLSTLTAAGFGQCLSDMAGFTCGGIVDATVARLNLPTHGLSLAQLDLKSSRFYHTLGGCVGVVTGCLLGMTSLLFMDTARADRAKKAKELQTIFESVIEEGHTLLHADRATLWLLDPERDELWSRVATGETGIIRVPAGKGIVGVSIKSGTTVNVADSYHDDRFYREIDKQTGYCTKSNLVLPIRNDDGTVIGAIQMINKKNADGSIGVFSKNDETMVKMLASHVSTFIRIMQGG